jgi:flavin-binding protein dodecin
MSVAKNIEISSTSPSSFEDAIEKGIARASRTINNVTGAWIKDQKINISGGRATEYQVMMIITFVLDDAGGDDDDDGGGSSGGRGGKSGGKGKKR